MAKHSGAFVPQPYIQFSQSQSKARFDSGLATPMVQLGRGKKHFEQGVDHTNHGRWKQALRDFEKAIFYAPNQPTYYYCYGVSLTHANRFGEAIKVFEKELAINPDHPSTLTEIGTCLGRMGRTKEGITYLERGLARWPNMVHAQFSLGLAYLNEKRTAEAILVFTKTLALDPSYVDAYRQRGFAYALQGNENDSVEDLWAAAALSKKDHETLVSLGVRLEMRQRDFDAGTLLEAAARMAPDRALPQAILGLYMINRRQCEEGLVYAERALELDPLLPNGHIALGFGLLGQGQIDEAVKAFRRAGELSPTDSTVAGSLLFALQHNPGVNEAEVHEAHTRWASLYRPAAGPKNRLAFANDPNPDRKLRIGIVSADLRGHAVTFLTLRAFEQLPNLGYEIFCYKTDGKMRDDKFSDRFKAISKSWKDISTLNDEKCSELLAEQGIDILFDLSGHTAGNRLSIFAQRSAPIQLSWAGYVGTTGLDTYEGIIADPVEVPVGREEFYVEPIVRLPDCYVCFEPNAKAPPVGPLPAQENETFTFGCFNRPAKINIEVARAWKHILDRVPNSTILLAYGNFKEDGTRKNITRIFEEAELPLERVEMLGEGDQIKLLAAYNRVDLALDPFPYSGGVTTLESIWMGVPVVTVVGETFAGRHSASHLTAAGLAQFCTTTIDAYVDMAVNWASRREELAELRRGLRDQVAASPLLDAERFARNLDEAMRGLWKDWCALKSAAVD